MVPHLEPATGAKPAKEPLVRLELSLGRQVDEARDPGIEKQLEPLRRGAGIAGTGILARQDPLSRQPVGIGNRDGSEPRIAHHRSSAGSPLSGAATSSSSSPLPSRAVWSSTSPTTSRARSGGSSSTSR